VSVWLFLLLALLLPIGWIVGKPLFIEYRRRRIRARPFPDAWRKILQRHMPYFRSMPADLQLQLKGHIQVFIAEKQFVGCDGLQVTDQMRVLIAAYACLLILNRNTDYYPTLRQILIYPAPFVVDLETVDAAGVLHKEREVRSGESWLRSQVVLSWQDVAEDALFSHDGRNVVIHEFAHQLDQQAGDANGAPLLDRREHYEEWSEVFGDEFERLQERERSGEEEALFDYYGATNPAEFFAVVSEVFFEQPDIMVVEHPELYRQLVAFYRLDPLSW
jgi:Mlc titration factor MtfA (ptsG expression regulator)